MARCFSESQKAYAEGDGARAKQLSEEGKKYKGQMEKLNKEASDWIFTGEFLSSFWRFRLLIGIVLATENNKVLTIIFLVKNLSCGRGLKDCGPGEIDLHGLFVKEAIERTDLAIQGARERGDTEVRLIVGKKDVCLSCQT